MDEDAFDPKKLFNGEEYGTLIISRDGYNKKENTAADLLEDLVDKKITRQESEAIFQQLKEAGAQKVMVDAIKAAKRAEEKANLTAACWECGLDFSAWFLDFVKLSLDHEFSVALEALSVVESSEGTVEEAVLTEAMKMAQSSDSPNKELVHDLVENIKSRI